MSKQRQLACAKQAAGRQDEGTKLAGLGNNFASCVSSRNSHLVVGTVLSIDLAAKRDFSRSTWESFRRGAMWWHVPGLTKLAGLGNEFASFVFLNSYLIVRIVMEKSFILWRFGIFICVLRKRLLGLPMMSVGWLVGNWHSRISTAAVSLAGPSQRVRKDLWPFRHLIRVIRRDEPGVYGSPEVYFCDPAYASSNFASLFNKHENHLERLAICWEGGGDQIGGTRLGMNLILCLWIENSAEHASSLCLWIEDRAC